MDELTVDRIIAVHDTLLAGTRDDARLLSEPNLHQLAFRVNLEPDLRKKATLILFSLCAYPAFRDGNKRTATKLAAEILQETGYTLDPTDPELIRILAGITDFTIEPEDIEKWLLDHASWKERK